MKEKYVNPLVCFGVLGFTTVFLFSLVDTLFFSQDLKATVNGYIYGMVFMGVFIGGGFLVAEIYSRRENTENAENKENGCEHDFKELLRIEHYLFRRFIRLKDSVYSKCVKCKIMRHDNDGDLFYGKGEKPE